MKISTLVLSLSFFMYPLGFISGMPLFAEEGVRVGTTWTDAEGNNYDEDPTYSTSSSGSTYTGPTWEDRMEWKRQQEEAQRQQQAVNINDEGVEHAKQGNPQKALECYQRAAAIDPANSTIQNNIRLVQGTIFNEQGIQYYSAGDYQKAAEAYQQALAFKPESEVIRQNLEDAQQQLAYQQEYQRKADLKRMEMEAAGSKIQGMLTDLSQSLKTQARPSALSFKPAAVPQAGFEGSPPIARKEELAFKNMAPNHAALEAVAPVPIEGSKTTQGQLKSVELHSRIAAGSGSYEGMKGNSAIGFDTKGVPGDELSSSAVRVPEVVGVPLGEVLPPPVPAEKRTPAIEKYETERGELWTKRKEIETKVTEMEKAEKPDTVEIVKLREEATQIKNKENFLSFQITEELAKAPEVKTEAPPVPPVKEGSEPKNNEAL